MIRGRGNQGRGICLEGWNQRFDGRVLSDRRAMPDFRTRERGRGMRTQRIAAWVAVAMATTLLAGCRVESDKHGDSDNVKISTPFGGMQVKTNDAVVVEDIGLPAYPAAQLVKKDKDNGSADVNMNFGSFHLRVKAASFRTDDSPDKVEAFYRNGMKRYGDVI